MGEAVAGNSVARAVAVGIEVATGVGDSGGSGVGGGVRVSVSVGGIEGGCFGLLVSSIADNARIINNRIVDNTRFLFIVSPTRPHSYIVISGD